MTISSDEYQAPPQPRGNFIVVDGVEYDAARVTLSSMARMKREHLDALFAWLDAKRGELEQHALDAEAHGRRIAEEMRPRMEATAAAAKRVADRERWLQGGDAA